MARRSAMMASMARRNKEPLHTVEGLRQLPVEDADARIEAYVYGNILILTALVALYPADAESAKGLVVIAATGVTTYIAHMFAEFTGHRVRGRQHLTAEDFRRDLLNGRPIASSATAPVLLMAASWLGWVSGFWALIFAEAFIIFRLGALGFALGHIERGTSSLRNVIAGIVLALVATAVAVVKAFLTH